MARTQTTSTSFIRQNKNFVTMRVSRWTDLRTTEVFCIIVCKIVLSAFVRLLNDKIIIVRFGIWILLPSLCRRGGEKSESLSAGPLVELALHPDQDRSEASSNRELNKQTSSSFPLAPFYLKTETVQLPKSCSFKRTNLHITTHMWIALTVIISTEITYKF
jgi:hypothetical protein